MLTAPHHQCSITLFSTEETITGECEKQELNLRTPAGTDLESASVGHLDILAWNNVGSPNVLGFEFSLRGYFSHGMQPDYGVL
jgi:hypothetical protein